jgi:hypothetical protein
VQPAGYSGTPLAKKLGMKPGQRVAFVGLPAALQELASAEPFASVDHGPTKDLDLILAFFTSADALEAAVPRLKTAIKPAGMVWIAWPKKASKAPTDITEDVIRRLVLPRGLVDVKVCAISEVWSGLKLVIPVAQRPGR